MIKVVSNKNFILLALAILASTGCVGGRFVGTNFIPTKMYQGDELPDTKISTIYWGKIVTHENRKWFAPTIGIDNIPCKEDSFKSVDTSGKTFCGSLVQVTPGNHTLNGLVRSVTDTNFSYSGYYKTMDQRWVSSKPLTSSKSFDLKPGYIYATIPIFNGKDLDIDLVEVCQSDDHISAIKNYFLANTQKCQ